MDKTPYRPEMTRFRTYYTVPDLPANLDTQVTALIASFATVRPEHVLQRLAVLALAIVDRVERSIYDSQIGCAIYRKACQILFERDMDPWELCVDNTIAEAFHQDAYDGLPGVDEYDPFTSLGLIRLMARAVIDRKEVIEEMLSGSFHTYNRERVAMAGILTDGRFVPYLAEVLENWKYPDPPRQVLGALGQIGTGEAVAVIRKYLKGDDETTVSAIEALEHANNTEALEALYSLKNTGSFPPELDVAIANIAEGIGGLLRMARSGDPKIRGRAMERLGGLKDPRAVLTLADALEDAAPVAAYDDGREYTVAEVACNALDYYGRAYLRRILPEELFNKFKTMMRRLRYERDGSEGWNY